MDGYYTTTSHMGRSTREAGQSPVPTTRGCTRADDAKNGHCAGSGFSRGWISYRGGLTISAISGIRVYESRTATVALLPRLAT